MNPIKAPSTGSPKKFNVFAHVKYEHMVAGVSGGVASTLILHPLDLIKIRFAGESSISPGNSTLHGEKSCLCALGSEFSFLNRELWLRNT